MPEKPVLGIDLGTTYSCVARLDDNERVTVLANSDGEYTTPSVVYYESPENAVVGKVAKKEIDAHPESVVSLIKRHMGEPGYTVRVGNEDLSPQEVSAVILRFIVEDALSQLGVEKPKDGPLADVVITVPAYFGAAERSATVEAGTGAGLNVLNIINEPTAAAIAYGVANAGGQRTVLVYDLGGGTFDVTVIKVSDKEIRVVATGGDHSLGGADWDERITEMLADEFAAQHPELGDPRTDLEASNSLTLIAEEVKKDLQKKESTTVTVVAHGDRARIELSRDGVLERTEELLARTFGYTRQVLDAAREKGVDRIDDLLLVGGMSRFHVAERLIQEFPELPEARLMDPDQIVAKGAALFAAHQVAELDDDARQDGKGRLAGPHIINVTSKGYGAMVVRDEHDKVGYIDWLINPNDEIPASPRETFRTVSANQTRVQIEVYESTTDVLSEVLTEHRKLIEGELVGLPSGRPAGQPVEVSYNLGEDGILRVTATASGQELRLEKKIDAESRRPIDPNDLPNIMR